jgi:hypothetical protein
LAAKSGNKIENKRKRASVDEEIVARKNIGERKISSYHVRMTGRRRLVM